MLKILVSSLHLYLQILNQKLQIPLIKVTLVLIAIVQHLGQVLEEGTCIIQVNGEYIYLEATDITTGVVYTTSQLYSADTAYS